MSRPRPNPTQPPDRRERRGGRRALDPEPLDLAFLGAVTEAPDGAATRSYLEGRAGDQAKVVAAVPRWLAGAGQRRLIERDGGGSEGVWRISPLGTKRLAQLRSDPRVPHIPLSDLSE